MIEINNLCKTFRLSSGNVDAVNGVSLSVEDGTIYGIIGYSGAGKSTLVRCINLLEVPDSGRMRVGEREISFADGTALIEGRKMRESEINCMRRGIGMIFQHFNLLDRSTVFDNVAYPLKYSKRTKAEICSRVLELLELVGLSDKVDAYPSQLSGGQKQRVAIARALANEPDILLSDEATSALDPEATESILNLLKELNRKLGLTVVLITHEMSVIKSICRRVAVMENGKIVEEGNVYDVFSHPQDSTTKRFVASTSSLSKVDKLLADRSALVTPKPGNYLMRFTFDRNTVGDSMISNVSRKFGVDINIVLANVEIFEDTPVGGMVAVVEGEKANIDRALDFMRENNVATEVLAVGR